MNIHVLEGPVDRNLMSVHRALTRHSLTRFLAASVVLHLCLLVSWHQTPPTAPERHLGQSVLSVQFQSHAQEQKPVAPVKTVTAPSISAMPAAEVAMPVEPAIDAWPSVASVDVTTVTHPEDERKTGRLHNQLLGALRTRLSQHLSYPPLARSRGWEGTVLLSLRVEADGELDRIRLERSSGHALLDHSALNSLKRLGRLVEARAWMDGRSLDMQIPVIFQLIEN